MISVHYFVVSRTVYFEANKLSTYKNSQILYDIHVNLLETQCTGKIGSVHVGCEFHR